VGGGRKLGAEGITRRLAGGESIPDDTSRRRLAPPRVRTAMNPLFNIVLLHPEIPNNTGNIGRTALAAGCRLHLIHPLGFSLDEKALRRAGLDYWHHVDCVEHSSWEAYLASERPSRVWLYTTHGRTVHWNAPLQRGDHLLFGRESGGVGDAFLARFQDEHGVTRCLRIPMVDRPEARSLNLATAVCTAVYEGWRTVEHAGASDHAD